MSAMTGKPQAFEQHPAPELVAEIASQCSRAAPPQLSVLIDSLQTRFGQALTAILLYGSCLRSEDITDGVIDLYAVVDDYHHAYAEQLLRLFNACLPPNVFYLEAPVHQHLTLRSKYAVISIQDFERGSTHWFHSYMWARFAQPVRLLYTRDESTRVRIHTALAQAVLTFLRSTIPVLGTGETDTETIWTRGLTLTYAAELRAEKAGQARQLAQLNLGDYLRLTAHAAAGLKGRLEPQAHGRYRCLVDENRQRRAIWQWRVRRWQGRILSLLRLAKAVFTFRDCIDYAAWKIKRHTGISVEVTPLLRRHPLLLGTLLLWRLLWRGTIR